MCIMDKQRNKREKKRERDGKNEEKDINYVRTSSFENNRLCIFAKSRWRNHMINSIRKVSGNNTVESDKKKVHASPT